MDIKTLRMVLDLKPSDREMIIFSICQHLSLLSNKHNKTQQNNLQLPAAYEQGLVLQQLRCCGVLEVVQHKNTQTSSMLIPFTTILLIERENIKKEA